ncbi:MAG: UDP-N-acetylglucosamine 2-epimerase (non-hydrolyzing) [Candidatus Woesebacteria bacterium]|nr:MAG: UDP-N-acetylglucosamine 2-epimerase (non-hydrolyzing) [Candidatus Woesebacteria bacterium]
MNKKLKVLTVVGTRPEIIRLSEIIKELDKHVDHIFVHTGQNYDYELSQIFFDNLDLRKPDYFLNSIGKTATITVGNIITGMDKILEKEKPDAFLVLGDTNSSMSSYAAKRRKIPIFHMEAGNRCFDFRVPEEINRRLIDHLSDINMPYSELARQNLLREGLSSDRIIKTGSPMYEVLNKHKKEIDKSNILKKLKILKEKYFVLSVHREENVDSPINFSKLYDTLDKLTKEYKMPIIFSCHPRTLARIKSINKKLPRLVRVLKPLGFFDYLNLQINAFCTLSDSGTISEESSIIGFPAINLREAHERPEAMDEAAVIMSGLDPERVLQSINLTKKQQSDGYKPTVSQEYSHPHVSQKVLRIILSYINYIKRVVWYE